MIHIGREKLKLEDIYRILYDGEKIDIDTNVLNRVDKSYEFLKQFSKDKVIYGINTGLGPMAQYKINEKDQKDLQYNLIRSHSAGSGNPLPDIYVKALMICRLNTLLSGYSGIHPDTVILLKEYINRNIYPVVFEHGSVGASGDLVQLAHLALALIGEGEVTYDGKKSSTYQVLKKHNLNPLEMHIREGLGLINGTSCMTGIGMVNILHARNLLSWAIMASTTLNEIVQSYDDHFSSELNNVKLHKGQQHVARLMRIMASDSKLVKRREEHLYNNRITEKVLKDKVQEYYSLRCVPQILGPIYDTIEYATEILLDEVNSANDNPIVDVENSNVFHGGNFHGDYVSLEMDKLKMAITKLSMLSERQLNFMLNNKLNNILPPFVNLGTLGLNFGMQGVQFTATSTVAENQTLSFPMYVHSISCNNDNQDIVSMGSNSALITKKVIDNAFEVVAIELICLIQAVDYLKYKNKLSSFSKNCYEKLREVVPTFENDTPKHNDIKNVVNLLKSYQIVIPESYL